MDTTSRKWAYLCLAAGWLTLLALPSCRTLPAGKNHKERAEVQRLIDEHTAGMDMEARLQATLTSKQRFSGQVKLDADSCLMVSIQALLGIEVYRLDATGDRLLWLDRLGKRYGLLPTHILDTPLSGGLVDPMAALLTGRMCTPGGRKLSAGDFEYRFEEDKSLCLMGKDDLTGWEYRFDESGRLSQTTLSDGKQWNLSCRYSHFLVFPQGEFPTRIDIDLSLSSGAATGLSLELQRAAYGAKPSINTLIPKNYLKSELSDFIPLP